MLREEQIDIRRKRAAEETFRIQNLGRNRVFSDYLVANPTTRGQYRVSIRGFDVGDNTCECPDFRTNTLGTCKHIEAVLASLREDTPVPLRRRKATVTHPEIYLHYGEQLALGLHLPPRYSDQLRLLAETCFDEHGLWKGGDRYQHLIERVQCVPEEVIIFSDAMDFMEREIDRHEMAAWEEEMVARLDRGSLDLDDPASPLYQLLRVPLYPYQIRGALFAACRGRCILGDDMGLGKTIQTLAAAEILARRRGIERVLVVAPASVKYQWQSEVRRLTGRPVQVIDGSTQQRRAQYSQPTFFRLINYEMAVKDLDELNAWHPDLIVLDEAQRIKNWEAQTTRAIKKLRSRYAIVLTGTPLENKLEELYSIVQFVDDRRLGPAFQFLNDHRVLDEDGRLLGYRNLDRIREKLAPVFLRRTRGEVLTQLPARTDNTIFVELADAQQAPYAEHQATLGRLLRRKYLTEVDRRRILSCISNLRTVCNGVFPQDGSAAVSPKLDELADLLQDLLSSGPHKVVVFSQWETTLRQATEVARRLGLGYVFLHGEVRGKNRKVLLDRFADDPDCRIFFSTDAGGTGLNLQLADTVINLEVPWNPAVLEQRIARVHRMGQHRPVQVFSLVTRDTIEERVLEVLARKRSLFEGLFSGDEDEIAFSSLGQQTFFEAVRELCGEEPEEEPGPDHGPVSAPPVEGAEARAALVEAGMQLLEALARVVSTPGQGEKESGEDAARVVVDPATGRRLLQVPLPSPEQLERGVRALESILRAVRPGGSGEPRV